jgi:hypothetical protein
MSRNGQRMTVETSKVRDDSGQVTSAIAPGLTIYVVNCMDSVSKDSL